MKIRTTAPALIERTGIFPPTGRMGEWSPTVSQMTVTAEWVSGEVPWRGIETRLLTATDDEGVACSVLVRSVTPKLNEHGSLAIFLTLVSSGRVLEPLIERWTRESKIDLEVTSE